MPHRKTDAKDGLEEIGKRKKQLMILIIPLSYYFKNCINLPRKLSSWNRHIKKLGRCSFYDRMS